MRLIIKRNIDDLKIVRILIEGKDTRNIVKDAYEKYISTNELKDIEELEGSYYDLLNKIKKIYNKHSNKLESNINIGYTEELKQKRMDETCNTLIEVAKIIEKEKYNIPPNILHYYKEYLGEIDDKIFELTSVYTRDGYLDPKIFLKLVSINELEKRIYNRMMVDVKTARNNVYSRNKYKSYVNKETNTLEINNSSSEIDEIKNQILDKITEELSTKKVQQVTTEDWLIETLILK